MFRPVESPVSFPRIEEQVIRFWRERRIYEKSLEARQGGPAFVFYEGPPTANGLPHPGHCLTRAIKDLFPRYRTMRGYRCERKAGWDTHGLPVEVEVCKELGIHAKDEIERYGVEPFIRKCLESVFRYTKQWEQLTERLGFWIHLDQAYVTYHQSYVESVWWALKNLFDRGLLYQGHKIVWWWAQGGTALSSGEVGQGYRQVADPSVYVRFPLVDQPDTDLLVWTTTPWTLPNNQFAAVKPDLEYATVAVEGESRKLIVAAALVETLAAKLHRKLTVLSRVRGADLVGRRYVPPFDYYYKTQGRKQGRLKAGGREAIAWRVVPADFVTTDTGTGVVHQAPAFGEVDYEVLLAEQARFADGEGPPLICAVGPDGKFTAEAPDYQGRWVKDADRDIIRKLRADGTLLHQEQYLHEYPFCWRAEEDPLIQYPRKSWFIRTTRFKERMLANNRRIGWLPEHIRDGRFGNFLETNVDWALSRERFWGTPLPIWVCEETGYAEAVASYAELLAKPGVQGTEVWDEAKRADPSLSEHLKVHKPYIDAITYDSPKAPGKRMRRVSEVIDCWFDSGAMPFAQWGYPHQPGSRERLADQFPADFISEALDQTRGWFYSLLAISTLLFSEDDGAGSGEQGAGSTEQGAGGGAVASDRGARLAAPYPHPFRNCVVLGLMLGEDGQKMSKSKRNYREPDEIFDRYGADALRWYFFANQPPWTSIRYSEQAIKESIPEFLLRLWNVYSFFVIYANIDGFDPAASGLDHPGQLDSEVLARANTFRPVAQRSELDRWILSELNRTAAAVVRAMDAYDNFAACQRLGEFVDALSNWYVRRSRDRFWSGEVSDDKSDAYWTLYECLLTTAKLIAPFVPFLAERLWQGLAVEPFTATGGVAESVHLCDYPAGDPAAIDEALSRRMALVREIVSLGRSARMAARQKVRQPLPQVEVVLTNPADQRWLEDHAWLVLDELNVKKVEFTQRAEQYITYTVLPDLKRLGPRLGRRLPALRQLIAQTDPAELLRAMEAEGQVTFMLADGPVALDSQDLQVRLQAKEGWTAAQGKSSVVVLST
ncbi:MAG: isoleucine--tRNA ligase, partial [Thermoguttaceae bacterium]|nr:isoleucine--tRNA ligase [Thermoguttaceae bacterium]